MSYNFKVVPPVTKEERIEQIKDFFGYIMEALSLDLTDESLKNTPLRVAKMLVNDYCRGLFEEPPIATTFPNDLNYDQMLLERNITLTSMCEHHFVTFSGLCHIAYFPSERVIGLSKFPRIVQYFSARPQLQERLNQQIGEHLKDILQTEDVAVVIQAKHLCCSTRGARDTNCDTVTSFLSGSFRDQPDVRAEFFSLIGLRK